MKRILQIISIIADIVGIIMFINFMTGWTLKDIICNSYLKVLVYTSLITGVVFLFPYLNRKIKPIVLKSVSYTLLLIISGIVIWIIPQGNCTIPVPSIAQKIDSSTSKNISHKDTSFKKKTPAPNAPKRPQRNVVKTDSSAPSSKYDLKDANFNGPTQVGDNNTQNVNYEGIKQRHPTQELINRILDSLVKHKMDSIFFLISPADQESYKYMTEIGNLLFTLGIRKLGGGSGLFASPENSFIGVGIYVLYGMGHLTL